MPVSDIERRILEKVVDRFLAEKQPTHRKVLIIEFEDPDAIDRLIRWQLLRTSDSDFYLPTALSFHYCGNAKAEELAKRSIQAIASIFRKQYSEDKPDFTPEGLEKAIKTIDGRADSEMLRIGLYLAPDFRLLSGWAGGNPQQPDITPTSINEGIVKLRNIPTLWDEYVRQNVPWGVQDSTGGVAYPNSDVFGLQTANKLQDGKLDMDNPNPFRRKERDSKGTESPTSSPILVFISHSSRDAELALALIEFLKAGLGLRSNQIRCSSVDGYRLPVGVNTEGRLREEVNHASVVVGLITPSSLASSFVMFELGARWGASQFLAPLLAGVKSSELTGPLSLLNALESSNESQLHQMLEDVSKRLGMQMQSAASYYRYIADVKRLSEGMSVPPVSQVAQKEDMVFAETVYWKLKDRDRQGPYCPNCFDSKQTMIHLNPGATRGTYHCGICGNAFSTREYVQGSTRRRPFSSR